jgi:hypothetical protein
MLSTIGILGSAVSLTSGIVLALAGSLAFGLVGGLVAVAGALVPFAAALGVGAAALASMDKKSKTFKTLKADFRDLQKTAQQGLFGKNGENLGAVSGILKGLGPIVRGVAGALGGLLKQFGEFAKTKPFKNLISDMGNLLPGMVTQLGHIFGNLAIFIGEAFVAAGPIINEFLGWLEGISKKLADFGKGGKKSGLAKFFDDAWASAKIVGNLILQIALAIGDLFSAGKSTGDSIFVELTQQVKDFRDWLAKAQADGSLKQFFDDAKRLGDELGKSSC